MYGEARASRLANLREDFFLYYLELADADQLRQ